MGRRGRPRAQARRHVLAGDRRRVRRRAEGDRPPRARAVAAELGDLVLHVRRPLQEEVQPEPRPLVLLREGPQDVSPSTTTRSASPRPGSSSTSTRGPTPRAASPTTPGSSAPRTSPTASPPRATPGTSPASAARSRSAPAGTAARCPSSSWAGSSAPARTPARSSSTRSAAAARPWPWPRSSTAASSASSSPPTTCPDRGPPRNDQARPAARRQCRSDGGREGDSPGEGVRWIGIRKGRRDRSIRPRLKLGFGVVRRTDPLVGEGVRGTIRHHPETHLEPPPISLDSRILPGASFDDIDDGLAPRRTVASPAKPTCRILIEGHPTCR